MGSDVSVYKTVRISRPILFLCISKLHADHSHLRPFAEIYWVAWKKKFYLRLMMLRPASLIIFYASL